MHMQASAENLKIRLVMVGEPIIDFRPPVHIEGGLSADRLQIQYAVAVRINRPDSVVDVEVTMSYYQGRDKLFSGTLTNRFEVIDLAEYIIAIDGSNEFQVENDFIPMLVSVSFSTTRGYFVRELQDTELSMYPFPIIPLDMIQKRTSYQLI